MGNKQAKAAGGADAVVDGVKALSTDEVDREGVVPDRRNVDVEKSVAAVLDGKTDEKFNQPQDTATSASKAPTPGGKKTHLPSDRPRDKTGKKGKKGNNRYKGANKGGGDEVGNAEKNKYNDDFDESDPPMVAGGPGEEYTPTRDEDDPDKWGDTVTWLATEMSEMRIATDYPEILTKSIAVLKKWRAEFPKSVWLRVIKSGRIAKELNECAPVIARVMAHVDTLETPADESHRANIIDLCSGFGYLGMFLSEMLDAAKVKMIVLLDKQWPMRNAQPAPHQINWDHVYGVRKECYTYPGVTDWGVAGDDAFEWLPDWPIDLQTLKMDIKQAGQLRQMEQHVFRRFNGPYLILAVHLCGTLSVKAVEMFNYHGNASLLCLKPCCLPEWNHTYTHDNWVFEKSKRNIENSSVKIHLDMDSKDTNNARVTAQITYVHKIPCTSVCAPGKWRNNKWVGPPRSHLRKKFDLWTDHLCKGVDVSESEKSLDLIKIQEEGGHQNLFVFAERTEYETTPQPSQGRYGGGPDIHDAVSEKEGKRRRQADRRKDFANGERSKKMEKQRREKGMSSQSDAKEQEA